MSIKLIQTKHYLLLIDEGAEIKPDEYILHDTVEGVIIANDEWDYRGETDDYWNKIIAYYPLTKEAKDLDLPLLPNPFNDEFLKSLEDEPEYERELVLRGYMAAQAKQFSLEDVKKAIEMAREYEFIQFGGGDTESKYTEEEIIQSLSTQQLPKEFVLGEGGNNKEQIKNGHYVY